MAVPDRSCLGFDTTKRQVRSTRTFVRVWTTLGSETRHDDQDIPTMDQDETSTRGDKGVVFGPIQ